MTGQDSFRRRSVLGNIAFSRLLAALDLIAAVHLPFNIGVQSP